MSSVCFKCKNNVSDKDNYCKVCGVDLSKLKDLVNFGYFYNEFQKEGVLGQPLRYYLKENYPTLEASLIIKNKIIVSSIASGYNIRKVEELYYPLLKKSLDEFPMDNQLGNTIFSNYKESDKMAVVNENTIVDLANILFFRFNSSEEDTYKYSLENYTALGYKQWRDTTDLICKDLIKYLETIEDISLSTDESQAVIFANMLFGYCLRIAESLVMKLTSTNK